MRIVTFDSPPKPPFSDFKIRKNICLLCHIGTLINGLNPATNILIFLDGSSFPVTHDCETQTAGSSAIVFFPSENYSIETSVFLGHRDSSYAELYSVHLALEVIHNQMRVCKFPAHVQVHFITDSKDVQRMISTNCPPTRHTDLVQFLRQEVAQTLQSLKPHFHWVASHTGLSPHDRADTLAKSAALSAGTPPTFPPVFCHKHYQKGMRLTLPKGLASQNDLNMDEEIYPPDLSGNTSLLIAKFFTNYLISNPGHSPTIEDGWFSAFLNTTYTPPLLGEITISS